MRSTTKWWLAAPLAAGLVVAACGGDDDSDEAEDTGSSDTASGETAAAAGVVTYGDGELTVDRMLCFFEEQERAGLGGVWTHTAQGRGTTPEGEPFILDLDRARDEDGTVEDGVRIDIGEPGAEDMVSLSAGGPEGLVTFGDDSVAVESAELTAFEQDPVTISFAMDCT